MMVVATHSSLQDRDVLRARAASCDVTPRGRPVRLAGYTSRTEPVSAVLDPVEVSAILVECTGRRCLIIGFDLMIVGSELKELILVRLARHGFRPGEIVLLASHTHFAPATDQACSPLGLPERQFVNDVAEAVEGLLPKMLSGRASEIELAILRGPLSHSINRRRHWPFPTLGRTHGLRFSSVAMAPSPQGPTNELATVLLLRKPEDGEVLGVIWHYACHPTAVVPHKVISSDYPGTVRRALRRRFGDVPCVFAQGFSGDIRPNIPSCGQTAGFRDRLRRIVRAAMSGPSFRTPTVEEWERWSDSLAARVLEIAQGAPNISLSPTSLAVGSASVALNEFFEGSVPDKPLEAHVVRFGDDLEFVALSAEATVGWEGILDQAVPVQSARIRLYAGYLGALFGYLPTPSEIREGGYEVEGFQPLFGLSGKFDADQIAPAVIGCVRRAFEDLESVKQAAIEAALGTKAL